MASIYLNKKDGKIISFKFKTVVERDKNGKQITQCTTWKCEKALSPSKLIQRAEKEALIWEERVRLEYEEEKNRFQPRNISFEEFIKGFWLPHVKKNSRPTTYEFREYMLKPILAYFSSKTLHTITDEDISEYLEQHQANHEVTTGKRYSEQTMKHQFSTLNLIFKYAVKMKFIEHNPLEHLESPKLTRHKVDSLTEKETSSFMKALTELPLRNKTMEALNKSRFWRKKLEYMDFFRQNFLKSETP